MGFCDFCHEPCGERRFCDEVCYEEYQNEMAAFMESVRPDEEFSDE